MVFKITFFQKNITSQDWLNFLTNLFSVTFSFHFHLIFQKNKLDFYIESSKDLEIINNRLQPFHLSLLSSSETLSLFTPASSKTFLPQVIIKPLIETIENCRLKFKNPTRLSLKLNKLGLFKSLPQGKLFSLDHAGVLKSSPVCFFIHLSQFLSFDLTNSISWDVSKVKPSLKAKEINLSLFSKGILELDQHQDNGQVSLKSYDFNRHSLILGQSGSGKSFLAKLIIDDLFTNFPDQYSIVLVDPHASLHHLISSTIPQSTIDFSQIQTDLFLNIGQPALSTELTLDLFSTILKTNENQNLARTLKYSLSLLFSVKVMNLTNLKKLLTDSLYRKETIKLTDDMNIQKFFDTEFQQIRTSHYETAVLPILNLVSELDFAEKASQKISLPQAIDDNFLVTLAINQAELGSAPTKIIGGAIIQQVFAIMQSSLVKKKVVLIIDEFAIVQTPSLIHILSEARKFGLNVILTQQYLLQVTGDILSSVFANTVNYFCFKLSRDDAEIVARNLNFEIDEFFLQNKNDPRESQELGTKLLTDLGTQEVISRLMVNGTYCPPFKSKTPQVIIEQGQP